MADRFKEIVTTDGTNATWSITPYTGETAGGSAIQVKDDGDITGSAVTTTGEANKLLKFSSIANTILHFFRIKKSSTTAFNVKNDTGIDVFNVDTVNNNVVVGGLSGTGNRAVFADSTGKLTNGSGALKDNSGIKIRSGAGPNVALMDVYDISFHYVNNTTLRICMKGEDGVMRSVNLTLS